MVVQEDPIIQRLGPPDEIMYGMGEGETEPGIFINKKAVASDRWIRYVYKVDGWIIHVTTKDKRVVRITSDNIKESEERARTDESGLKKALSR